MVKVLLDTDIGSDIDDAVCLAYLLKQKNCSLMGITTVSGEPEKRAMLADALCQQAGVDVPIHSGISEPLLAKQIQPRAGQAASLTAWKHRTDFQPNSAVTFLRDTIVSHPGEITLLAIGPLTNIGLLFSTYPETVSLLKEVVLMAGRFFPPGAASSIVEWNVQADPHAAAIVCRAPVKKLTTIGLDVTCQVKMAQQEVMQAFQAEILRPVLDFSTHWFAQAQAEIIFHDPLAAAILFEPDICGYKRGRISVELGEGRLMGFTHFDPGDSADCNHYVASSVDSARFFSHYFDTVNG